MTEIAARKYTVELHDPADSDALVAILENAHNIAHAEVINEAPILRFDLPADDSKAASITKANEIWLRNYSTGALLERFRLVRKTDKRAKTLITTISAEGLLNQLADEYIEEYEATPGENLTVTQIVDALLALQTLTPVITRGTINPAVSRSIKASGNTILKIIRKLHETVGGYVYLDTSRALQWRTSIGKDEGQQIRYRKNLEGITRMIDYTTLANRLYAYGEGEGEARIKLSDVASELTGNAGSGQPDVAVADASLFEEGIAVTISDDEASEENTIATIADNTLTMENNLANTYTTGANGKVNRGKDYIEDTASQAEWEGIYSTQIVDKSITHPDTLLAWVRLELVERATPRITYQIDAVDLSESIDVDFSFEALQIGSTIKVIDEELGIDVSVRIVKLEHTDLSSPGRSLMRVEVANQTKDIADSLAEVYDTQQLMQHTAIKIGAGQVTVLGTVTVLDWASAGKTTIDGGKITALSLDVGAIKTSTLGAITITLEGINSILKGNYEIGVSGWQIRGDGNAEFNNVTVRGNIQAGAGSSIAAGHITSGDIATARIQVHAADGINAGETTISGGKITTNTLDVDVIKTSTLGAKTITLSGASSILKGNYAAGVAGWQIKGDGDAEFNEVTVRGAIYASSGEFTGTLKATTLEAGKTLTVSGTISVAGGAVVLDADGGNIHDSDHLRFWYGAAALRGSFQALSDRLSLYCSGYPFHVVAGGVLLAAKARAPTANLSEGLEYYNATTKYKYVYHTGAWHALAYV